MDLPFHESLALCAENRHSEKNIAAAIRRTATRGMTHNAISAMGHGHGASLASLIILRAIPRALRGFKDSPAWKTPKRRADFYSSWETTITPLVDGEIFTAHTTQRPKPAPPFAALTVVMTGIS